MKAIIYARVSTEMQEEGRSLEFQIRKCEDFCKYNNYTVKEVIQDVESGGNDNREGFLRLQKEIKKKSFDVLVVYESSRISRITLTMLNFVLELQKSDIKFISISQSEINTTTPTGMLFFQIFAVLADYERKQISMRVKSNKWARAKAGIWQGGNVPIGYKKIGKEIVIDEETKEDVIGIFNTYLATKSLKETAKILGKNISSIKWILQNEFYIGNLMYGRKQNDINTGIVKVNKEIKIFKGNHPALIDEDIFREAQQQMLFKQRYTRIEDKYLFTGLIECTCGGKLYTNAPNYRCEKCKKAITRNKAEKFIINKLLHLKELEFLNSKPNLEKYENDKKSCETQINKLYKEREKYISLYTKDLISEEELEKRLNEIKAKMEFFEKSLEDINRIIESKTLKSNEIDNVKILKEVLDNIDETDRYDLFKMFRMLIKVIKIKKYQPLEVLILLRQ